MDTITVFRQNLFIITYMLTASYIVIYFLSWYDYMHVLTEVLRKKYRQ